jgi:hypothetical protein
LDDHNCRTPEIGFEDKRNTLLKQLQSFVEYATHFNSSCAQYKRWADKIAFSSVPLLNFDLYFWTSQTDACAYHSFSVRHSPCSDSASSWSIRACTATHTDIFSLSTRYVVTLAIEYHLILQTHPECLRNQVLLVTSTQQTLSPEEYDAQVQSLMAAMGAIYASNKSDAELNRTKSESDEGAFPSTQSDSSLGAALDSFTPTTVQVPVLDGSGAPTTTFTSGPSADSMDVVDDRSQTTAGVSSATDSTTHQQFSSLASDASAMDVDNQKSDSDAMDVDKPPQ